MGYRVSAVVNTLNEEKNIRECLASLSWCDEIIVVDMKSDDATVEIAANFNVKSFEFPRVGYVEPARKFAVEQTTGDWILILDADEMVPVWLSEILKSIACKDEADVVQIPFKTFIMGTWIKHSGWWPEYHPRFFKRGCVAFSDSIHSEFNINSDARQKWLPADEANAIAHFAYRDSQHFVEKLNRYTTAEAQNFIANGRKFSLLRMFLAGFRGFQVRYINCRGYKDGKRGLFLAILMGFYRTLVYMKVWEREEYPDTAPFDLYREMKNELLAGYGKKDK